MFISNFYCLFSFWLIFPLTVCFNHIFVSSCSSASKCPAAMNDYREGTEGTNNRDKEWWVTFHPDQQHILNMNSHECSSGFRSVTKVWWLYVCHANKWKFAWKPSGVEKGVCERFSAVGWLERAWQTWSQPGRRIMMWLPPQMVFSPSLQANGNRSPILASAFAIFKRFWVTTLFFFSSFQWGFYFRIISTGCSYFLA